MNKQDIISDLKAVCFDIIYSQVKEILNGETYSVTLDKLQKTITSVDNLLSTIEDNQNVENENINLIKEETNSEEVQTASVDNTLISADDNNEKIKVETYQEDTSTTGLVQDKMVEKHEQNVEEKEVSDNIIDDNQEVVQETESEANKATIDYELEEYYRLTDNPVKAIIVNVNQLRKLRESLSFQKELLDFGVVAVTADTNTGIGNKEISIEELLEQASKLYKEGKILESEKLYEQIRNMNKEA